MCRAIALFWVAGAIWSLLHGAYDLFGLSLVMVFLADSVSELVALRARP